MKIIIAFFLLWMQAGFGQDCNTRAVSKPAVLTRGQDNYVDGIKGGSANIPKMKQHLGKAESWAKNLLTGFTGAKLYASNDFYFDYEHENTYSKNFYESTGINGACSFKMRFFAYYCYDNRDSVFTEGESGSFIRVTFNDLFISDLCFDAGVFTIGGRPVFRILEKDHSKGRIDFYDFRATATVVDTIYASKHEIILIRNSDKPVFITVTRKEYLEQLLNDLETYRTKREKLMAYIYESNVKQFEAELKIYKTMDKTFTPEKEALKRKDFMESNNQEKMDKEIKKLDDDVNASAEMIKQYMKKPEEWLSRSFNKFYPFSDYTAAGLQMYFDRLDNYYTENSAALTPTEVVYINPAYFDKSLSNDSPQLIIVHLQKKSYPHMLRVSRLVNKEGALAPLEAILR
jgi:hypothetical protein